LWRVRDQVRAAITFYPLYVDESILWAERKEVKGGFRRIHNNNMELVWHGGSQHGTRLFPFRWNGSRNQMWRIAPHTQHSAVSAVPELARRVRILSQSGEGLSLTGRDGTVVLATAELKDERQVDPPRILFCAALMISTCCSSILFTRQCFSLFRVQCWLQSFHNTGRVTDEEGHPAFVLMNQATGKALGRRNCGAYQLVLGLASPTLFSFVFLLFFRKSGGVRAPT
jgi:hypothetical protein